MVFGRHCRSGGSPDTQWQTPRGGTSRHDDQRADPGSSRTGTSVLNRRFLTGHFLMVLGGTLTRGSLPELPPPLAILFEDGYHVGRVAAHRILRRPFPTVVPKSKISAVLKRKAHNLRVPFVCSVH